MTLEGQFNSVVEVMDIKEHQYLLVLRQTQLKELKDIGRVTALNYITSVYKKHID